MGRILSVYVENENMRICEVSKSSGSVLVKNAFEVPVPTGIIDDGMIMDVEGAAKTLYAALKNNNIKRGKIAFVISSRKIANKEIVIPYIKNQKKIEELIKANLDEYFPMNNLEDYIYRHTILDTFENAEGKHISVLVMAFQKQMVEGYYQMASMMKMPVITVDYYGNAIYQLWRKQLGQGTVLAIHMDRTLTNVSIMKGKAQLFKRSIPYGRDTVVRNLADFKNYDEQEAREILEDPRKLDMELTPDEYSEVIRDFSSSITRVAEFHTSRNPGTAIELVKLMGTGIDLIGFPQVLGRELGIDVDVVKELSGVKIAKKNPAGLNYEQLVDYLPNVGALIQSLDLKVEEEKKSSGNYTFFYVLIVLATLTVAGVSAFLIYNYNEQLKVKNSLEKQVKDMAAAEAVYLDYLENKDDYDVIKAYYEGTVNDSEALYQLILDLEEVMPRSVGINTFTLNSGEITMTCMANGKEPVASFVIELKKLPYVSNVKVQNITDTYDEFDQVTSTFNLSFHITNMTEEEAAAGGQSTGNEQTAAAEGGAQ